MPIRHTLICICRHEQDCEAKDMAFGAVYQCDGCKKIWARVRPHRGGDAWIEVNPSDAEFHRLFEEEE